MHTYLSICLSVRPSEHSLPAVSSPRLTNQPPLTTTSGPTREVALQHMHEALDSYVIKGLSHNLCFLKELVRHPRFGRGDTSTKFIPQEFPDGFHGVKVGR